jgi:hypothetical protein
MVRGIDKWIIFNLGPCNNFSKTTTEPQRLPKEAKILTLNCLLQLVYICLCATIKRSITNMICLFWHSGVKISKPISFGISPISFGISPTPNFLFVCQSFPAAQLWRQHLQQINGGTSGDFVLLFRKFRKTFQQKFAQLSVHMKP